MKNFFSNPKRAILLIVFILLCVLMVIGGVTMSLSMSGKL